MSICFFIFVFFYRSLHLLFKPNQTQKKKKKISKSQKTNYQKYISLLILVLHSLQPITKKAHTHHNFLFFILINNNTIKKFIHINIVVGACGFLWVWYVLVMGSYKKSHPRPPPSSSSSPSSSQLADVAISGKRFFFSFVFCYYSYVGFRNVSAFNLKHWFFVLVSWGFGVKTYDSCFWICMFVFLFIYLFIFCIYLILNLNLNKPRSLNWLLNQKVWNWINIVFLLEMFQNL